MLALNWTDILDGEIVNAAWAVAGMVAKPRTSRRVSADLDTATWADTERLIRDALADISGDPGLPDLSKDEAAELEAAVRRPEVQGALQALLAVRLTDAPELDAARAREAVRLALSIPTASSTRGTDRRQGPGAVPAEELLPGFEAVPTRYAAQLSEYFDDKISALVASLEGRVGFAGLAQVRAEAFNARIVALLGAIERQVAALTDPGRRTEAEAQFLARYGRQAHQRHGFLTPPDFDRRRRVPVADIYVPTAISEEDDPERMRPTPETHHGSLKVRDLAGRLDRTVLLGDPGGGKTTAANVLTDHFARGGSPRIAFLVTLREYAAKAPIEWSVAEHIEHNLKTLYQVKAPNGLVERLLLTGRAVVIFDGLDELLDTSRRRDVSDRVEQFCSAYPLTPVLVTSRVVGYDQAQLDETQFRCYRLGGFGDDEVTEYARKWFRSQEGLAPAEATAKAKAFLAESGHAKDLRANPLLLSLMCILYRGAGSLPGDRAGIYARCAELLLRKWDEQRDLYRKLGSDHLVEPTLRYLAWWLFTRENSQTTATELELIVKAAEFLYERDYETEDQARKAARDFVEFCRGRMWVFSDAGTTADGEKLYGFTHRTFLEYFAAWHLAVTSDSPEDLARTLAPRIATPGWGVVAELAIKIKNDTIDRGVDRVYVELLSHELTPGNNEPLLQFLLGLLASVQPSPGTLRLLTRAALDYATDCGEPLYQSLLPLGALLFFGNRHKHLIAEELSTRVAAMVGSGDAARVGAGLWLALTVGFISNAGASDKSANLPQEENAFWLGWSREQAGRYAAELLTRSAADKDLRITALYTDALSVGDALAMPDGLGALLDVSPTTFESGGYRRWYPPYFENFLHSLLLKSYRRRTTAFTAIGQHAQTQGKPPWARIASLPSPPFLLRGTGDETQLPALDDVGNLGVVIVICVAVEVQQDWGLAMTDLLRLAPADDYAQALLPYVMKRLEGSPGQLPDLPIPPEFGQVLRDWAEGRVNFVQVGKGNRTRARGARARSA